MPRLLYKLNSRAILCYSLQRDRVERCVHPENAQAGLCPACYGCKFNPPRRGPECVFTCTDDSRTCDRLHLDPSRHEEMRCM